MEVYQAIKEAKKFRRDLRNNKPPKFKQIGEGVARTVYPLDETGRFVVKVENDFGYGFVDNRCEVKNAEMFAGFAPRIYWHSKDFRFLLVERVNPFIIDNKRHKEFFDKRCDGINVSRHLRYKNRALYNLIKEHKITDTHLGNFGWRGDPNNPTYENIVLLDIGE